MDAVAVGGNGVDVGVLVGGAVLVDVGTRVCVGDWDLVAVGGGCKASAGMLSFVEHDEVKMKMPIKQIRAMCFFMVHLLYKTIFHQIIKKLAQFLCFCLTYPMRNSFSICGAKRERRRRPLISHRN
jgi:hypothetical protein